MASGAVSAARITISEVPRFKVLVAIGEEKKCWLAYVDVGRWCA